tara:strand:+ start:794 stop:1285 length:492 start_codon:yes stop_codon:yes gene_type:complete
VPEVAVSLGSNLDRESNICAAVETIKSLYPDAIFSAVFESEAVGFEGSAFYNLAAAFETDLEIAELVLQLREIEAQQGRVRIGEGTGSREMDIDVLLYGDEILHSQGVNIPRDEILECAHILKPLSLIWPDRLHPVKGTTYRQLWEVMSRDQGESLSLVVLDC